MSTPFTNQVPEQFYFFRAFDLFHTYANFHSTSGAGSTYTHTQNFAAMKGEGAICTLWDRSLDSSIYLDKDLIQIKPVSVVFQALFHILILQNEIMAWC